MVHLPSVPKLLRLLGNRNASRPVSLTAERFLQVFRDHSVELAQIPRLLPQVKLDDLQSNDRLLGILTPELIDQVAQLFGIRSEWLEGVDDQIYGHLAAYKEPSRLLDHLGRLMAQPDYLEQVGAPLRVLTTTKCLDYRSTERQDLIPILIEPIRNIGDETIYRYHVYQDGYCWEHPPCRLELKAIARLIWKELRIPVPLYPIDPSEFDEILEGRRIPRAYLNRSYVTNPSLEDYAVEGGRGLAKESDELPSVLEYARRVGVADYVFKPEFVETTPLPTPLRVSPPPQEETTPKVPGKRATQREVWQAVENAATSIWAGEALTIQDMVRRLRTLPHIKLAHFEDDTVRKRISRLAPEGIRGKAGRKPKKSGNR